MSASQEKALSLPGSDVSATRDMSQSDGPDQTVEDTALKGNPNESSLSIPTKQDKPAVDLQSATSEHHPGHGDQSQFIQGHSDGQARASPSSDHTAEIRALQQRLSHLEMKANRPPRNSKSHRPRPRANRSEQDSEPGEEDKKLRKLVRKAPYGNKWVKEAEARAEETAEDRKEFGQAPNNASDGDPLSLESGTMYHVAKDGTMHEGDQGNIMVIRDSHWFANYGDRFLFHEDAEQRRLDEPHPLRGVRPPTALRPIYQEPRLDNRGSRIPPTEWDTSDTDEWSTDTSTKSRDFNYYRARLRGDFEWELDRLNAQVRRYRARQEKKQARLLADRAKAENERMEREFQRGGSQQYSMQRPDMKHAKPAGQYGTPSLNVVDWYMFRAARSMPSEISFAIDVLIGEPIVSDTTRGMFSATDSKTTSGPDNPSASGKTELIHDAKRGENLQWNGQGPLPERIRINSKPIIDNLSRIHGKALCAPEEPRTSVVMLRPFRMLNTYSREIRESSTRNADAASPDPSRSVPDTATQPPGSVETSTKGDQVPDSAVDVDKAPSTQNPVNYSAGKAENMEHLTCLHEFVDNYISRKMEYLNSTRCEKIVFSDIWYLFTPGTLVISSDGKQAYRVASLRSKRHKGTDRWAAYSNFGLLNNLKDKDENRDDMTIKCVFIHFDGRSLGPVVKTFGFNKFDGEKDVTSLDIYPLRFHVLKDINERSLKPTSDSAVDSYEQELQHGTQQLQERLVKRGRLFVSAAAVKHMYYTGLTVDTRDEIESQVIIDFEEAYSAESRREWRPSVSRLIGTVLDPEPEEVHRSCDAPCCWQENVHDDSYVETNRNQAFMNKMVDEIRDTPYKLPPVTIFPRSLEEAKTGVNALTDDELIIMSYSAPGFVLRDRSWANLDLDNLFEIERSSEQDTETADDDLDEDSQGAFGQLVLPTGHKKMVLSLISQHFRSKESKENKDEQLDIVRGKGKGLIILLHGAPGVGKTTTAEGVAEVFKKPLFQITCGDLGSNPKEVEAALQTNFALANKWGCILLLDEADVFLAERRREDFNRNGMVAVFLRVLEYYAGILFLTTNRIGDFDEAFASRIHMSLHYPALDEPSTGKVFRLNLNLIKNRLKDRIKIEEDEIIAAARQHWREQKDARWNGRQIRNACQTALALAEFDAQPKGQKYNIKEKSSTKIYLRLAHLNVVSKAYLEFTEYLKAVHGADAEGRAKESGLRALDTLIEALKRDKASGTDAGGGRSVGHDDRSAMNRSPLHGFKLGSDSHSFQQPPSSSSPGRFQQEYYPAYHGLQPHASQQPREAQFAQGHSMQYFQGPHPGSQHLADPQRAAVPAHLLQVPPPHAYPGGGSQAQAHYQMPQTQTHAHIQETSPPQGVGYTPGADTTSSTLPLTPLSPPYRGGDSQAGQIQPPPGGWAAPDQTGERGPGQGY